MCAFVQVCVLEYLLAISIPLDENACLHCMRKQYKKGHAIHVCHTKLIPQDLERVVFHADEFHQKKMPENRILMSQKDAAV